jgi:hypothetical protein
MSSRIVHAFRRSQCTAEGRQTQTEISSVVPSSRVVPTKLRPSQSSQTGEDSPYTPRRTLTPVIPMATSGRSLHARLGGGAGTRAPPFSLSTMPSYPRGIASISDCSYPRSSCRRAAVAAEQRIGGGRGGRHGCVVRFRARGLQLPLGPGQLPAPPRRHPLLLGQVRIAAQQVGLL